MIMLHPMTIVLIVNAICTTWLIINFLRVRKQVLKNKKKLKR